MSTTIKKISVSTFLKKVFPDVRREYWNPTRVTHSFEFSDDYKYVQIEEDGPHGNIKNSIYELDAGWKKINVSTLPKADRNSSRDYYLLAIYFNSYACYGAHETNSDLVDDLINHLNQEITSTRWTENYCQIRTDMGDMANLLRSIINSKGLRRFYNSLSNRGDYEQTNIEEIVVEASSGEILDVNEVLASKRYINRCLESGSSPRINISSQYITNTDGGLVNATV